MIISWDRGCLSGILLIKLSKYSSQPLSRINRRTIVCDSALCKEHKALYIQLHLDFRVKELLFSTSQNNVLAPMTY